jgi:hypothetical protein
MRSDYKELKSVETDLQGRDVLAVLISDAHLSHNPPRMRALEDDWYKAMERTWYEINDIAHHYKADTIFAGDLFDKWDSPAELINLAFQILPQGMLCIPGQHDLPNHDLAQLNRSAYAALSHGQRIEDLPVGIPVISGGVVSVTGFPWGAKPTRCNRSDSAMVYLAVVHAYAWEQEADAYPGAPIESNIGNLFRKELQTYDVVLIGDNHNTFLKGVSHKGGSTIYYNHGALMRRRAEERNHTPEVGLLTEDGQVIRRPLVSCKEDNLSEGFEVVDDLEEDAEAIRTFVESLDYDDEGHRFDYRQLLQQFIEREHPSKAVVTLLRRAIHEEEK